MAVCPEEEASDSVSHSLERGRWTIVVGSSDVVVTQAPLGGGYTRRQWLHATSVVTHTHHQWLHTHTQTHTRHHWLQTYPRGYINSWFQGVRL